jgi:hypothetical protein
MQSNRWQQSTSLSLWVHHLRAINICFITTIGPTHPQQHNSHTGPLPSRLMNGRVDAAFHFSAYCNVIGIMIMPYLTQQQRVDTYLPRNTSTGNKNAGFSLVMGLTIDNLSII